MGYRTSDPDDPNNGPIGELVDSTGVVSTLAGETKAGKVLITDAMVLFKVIRTSDGEVSIRSAYGSGMDWITRRGILEAVLDTERLPAGDDG